MGKIIKGIRFLRHLIFSGFEYLGWGVVFENNVRIINPGSISIGSNVFIDSDCSITAIKEYKNQKFVYKSPIVRIDENVGLGKGTIVNGVRKVQIKKDVMIGPYCFIGDYDHSYTDIKKSVVEQPLGNIDPVTIEEGAWLGSHVTIASGVRVGRNSVIGANSVVTKDVPDYAVAVGVPAKVIKKYNPETSEWEKVSMDKITKRDRVIIERLTDRLKLNL